MDGIMKSDSLKKEINKYLFESLLSSNIPENELVKLDAPNADDLTTP